MIVITGMIGRIGGRLAGHLTTEDIAVRGVVRDPKKGENWGAKWLSLSPRTRKFSLLLALNGNR
jgi:uncharacterized protein YbjT (DUF2867 family)